MKFLKTSDKTFVADRKRNPQQAEEQTNHSGFIREAMQNGRKREFF